MPEFSGVNTEMMSPGAPIDTQVGGMMAMVNFDIHSLRPFAEVATDNEGWPLYNQYTGAQMLEGVFCNVYSGRGDGDRSDMNNYSTIRVQNVHPMIANSTLRRDEWKYFDDAIVRAAQEELVGVDDLVSRGLTFDINGMMNTVLVHESIKSKLVAQRSMDGLTRGESDRPIYQPHALPLPIIHADYDIKLRELEISRKKGDPLNTEMGRVAGRAVGEFVEKSLFTVDTYYYGGGSSWSYVNFPGRNTLSLGAANDGTVATSTSDDGNAAEKVSVVGSAGQWNKPAATGEKIVRDVIHFTEILRENLMRGPYLIYVPLKYASKLDEDYSDNKGTHTIRQRILGGGGVEGIEGVQAIKVAPQLADHQILVIQMTSNVVELVRGMPITNFEWDNKGGWVTDYKVATIQVLRLRTDGSGHCGILHITYTG